MRNRLIAIGGVFGATALALGLVISPAGADSTTPTQAEAQAAVNVLATFVAQHPDATIPPTATASATPTQTASPTASVSPSATVTPTVAPTTAAPSRASGLAWSSGVGPQDQSTARVNQFAAFRGTPVDNVTLFPPRDSFTTLADPQYLTGGLPTGFQPSRDDLVVSLPLWPVDHSVSSYGTQAQWTSVANTIKGVDPSAYVRLGWEMNGSWMYWNLNSGNATAWRAAFHQIVVWMKTAAPGLQFVWNPNIGGDQTSGCSGTTCSRAAFQALKADVDVYGVDSYDDWPPDNTSAGQSTHLNSYLGESWTYAQANGKRFAVPEWGGACTDSSCQWAGHAGGDNAQYIHDYLGWFVAHASTLAFESYFDDPAAYIRSALDVTPIGPLAPAKYRADILANVH